MKEKLQFKSFIENESAFKAKLKLFGADAARVSTSEMQTVFQELQNIFKDSISHMELVRSIDSKQDHGDIDILIIDPSNLKNLLRDKLKNNLLNYSKNGNISSFLFNSTSVNKKVHVDFISSNNSEELKSKQVYYALNDVSAIVGIVSKGKNFKYGTKGFFKRFKDKQGNWHDIPITKNLFEGMKILGFDVSKYHNIKNHEDVIEFILSSPMTDSRLFDGENMVSRDRRMLGVRSGMDYIINKLVSMNIVAKIQDEDYLFKKYFLQKYIEVEKLKQEIDATKYTNSNIYTGEWVMSKFNLAPGKKVGMILKSLNDHFGANLKLTNETDVISFVNSIFNKI